LFQERHCSSVMVIPFREGSWFGARLTRFSLIWKLLK
jgi:hypothetical protein